MLCGVRLALVCHAPLTLTPNATQLNVSCLKRCLVIMVAVRLPVLLQTNQTEKIFRLPPARRAQDWRAGRVSALRQRRLQGAGDLSAASKKMPQAIERMSALSRDSSCSQLRVVWTVWRFAGELCRDSRILLSRYVRNRL